MALLECPYLGKRVELTGERREHILLRHPDLLPEHFDEIAKTLKDPDDVRKDDRFPATQLFSRWCEHLKGGKWIVVAVISDPPPAERSWVVTAYIARKLAKGTSEWTRD